MRIFNRCLEWQLDGLYLGADPRHAELAVAELGMNNNTPMSTPAVKTDPDPLSPKLDAQEATLFTRVVARCNFLAADRTDLQYSAKDCSKGMASPTKQHLAMLKRIC